MLRAFWQWAGQLFRPARPEGNPIAKPKSLPSFPCYHQRWMASTAHLSLAAQGLYWRYLCWSYDNGPLPLDERKRVNLSGVPAKTYRRLWDEFSDKWSETENGFVNPRLEELRIEASEYSESQKTRANRRWDRARADASASTNASAGAVPERCSPISTKQIIGAHSPVVLPSEYRGTSTQDPPAAPEDVVENLWKTDDETEPDVEAVMRPEPPDLRPAPDPGRVGRSHQDASGEGRIYPGPAPSAHRRDGRDRASDEPLTPAQTALALAQAMMAPGADLPKLAFCSAALTAAQRLYPAAPKEAEAVAMFAWTIWQLYPSDFTLMNPRDTPDRQRVRRLR